MVPGWPDAQPASLRIRCGDDHHRCLHIVKEFVYDRHRGMRWFSWVTGVPLVWLVIPLGITGYWLVWDQLAWYVALTSAELLDWLPIFSESMARNFLSSEVVSNRFFTLMAFMHLIGLPLFLVFGIWLHVLRINGPRINPPRALDGHQPGGDARTFLCLSRRSARAGGHDHGCRTAWAWTGITCWSIRW